MNKKLALITSLLISGSAFAHGNLAKSHEEKFIPSVLTSSNDEIKGYNYAIKIYTFDKSSPLFQSYSKLGTGITDNLKIPTYSTRFSFPYSATPKPMSITTTTGYIAESTTTIGAGKEETIIHPGSETQTYIANIDKKVKNGSEKDIITPGTVTTGNIDKIEEKSTPSSQTVLTPGKIKTGTLVSAHGILKDGQLETLINYNYSSNPTFKELNGIQIPSVTTHNFHEIVNIPIGKTYYHTMVSPNEIKIITVQLNK